MIWAKMQLIASQTVDHRVTSAPSFRGQKSTKHTASSTRLLKCSSPTTIDLLGALVPWWFAFLPTIGFLCVFVPWWLNLLLILLVSSCLRVLVVQLLKIAALECNIFDAYTTNQVVFKTLPLILPSHVVDPA